MRKFSSLSLELPEQVRGPLRDALELGAQEGRPRAPSCPSGPNPEREPEQRPENAVRPVIRQLGEDAAARPVPHVLAEEGVARVVDDVAPPPFGALPAQRVQE